MPPRPVIPAILLIALPAAPGARAGDAGPDVPGRTFHVDARAGRDSNPGTSAAQAWRSLARAASFPYAPGDVLVLRRGTRLAGALTLAVRAEAGHPFIIGAYGEGPKPVIDSAGFLAGVLLEGCSHVVVRDLELTADGGRTRDGSDPRLRYGVLVRGGSGITLERLDVHDVFPERGTESDGSRPTTHRGTAIAAHGATGQASEDIVVRDCAIHTTGFKAIELRHLRRVQVLGNRMRRIGGPAIQPGNVDDLLVRGNVVDGSGSDADPRMHGRGSGIWPWTCNRVLIEENRFSHARGPADSCGIHIDFNCRDVVVQYNLSHDNEGGFIEILGNNHNCAYRYNISVNDGARVKGRNGAHQEGKLLWTSGYVGRGREKNGPYNSYIYNNTIYAGPRSRSCFSVSATTRGLLVANNIFHVMGGTLHVLGDQDARTDRRAKQIPRAVMTNNLWLTTSVAPPDLPLRDRAMIVGDAGFANPGGAEARDYVPANAGLVRDRGIPIPRLEGDDVGLRIGLKVAVDFFGNPVRGEPDLGAIEIP